MKVYTNNSKIENDSSNTIKNLKKEKEKRNISIITISENYQGFISIIYFIIGCCFLFYLFSFVFSIYVSYSYNYF